MARTKLGALGAKLAAVAGMVLAIALGPAGCGDPGPIVTCTQSADCRAGEICIEGGSCAKSCDPAGPNQCPWPTTCQTRGAYCRIPACATISVQVCQ